MRKFVSKEYYSKTTLKTPGLFSMCKITWPSLLEYLSITWKTWYTVDCSCLYWIVLAVLNPFLNRRFIKPQLRKKIHVGIFFIQCPYIHTKGDISWFNYMVMLRHIKPIKLNCAFWCSWKNIFLFIHPTYNDSKPKWTIFVFSCSILIFYGFWSMKNSVLFRYI